MKLAWTRREGKRAHCQTGAENFIKNGSNAAKEKARLKQL